MTGAIAGLRVVEAGGGKAIAYAGRLLRGLGATVIKIEPPEGDTLRQHGPFPADQPDPEHSGQFIYLNGGKDGARLDLTTGGGRAALEALLADADVLLHSFRPQEARALGLDDERLRTAYPRLVVTAVTTFGHSGPYAGWKGAPLLAYCGAGVAYRIGDPEREPLTAPLDAADVQHAGVQATLATLLALHHRDRIGHGQFVDISALVAVNVAVWGHGIPQAVYLGNPIPQRNGRGLSGGVWGVYGVKDGDFVLMTQVARHWTAFVDGLGNPEWSRDELIRSLGSPHVRRNLDPEQAEQVQRALREGMAAQFARLTKAELWEITRRERIPFQPVLTIPEVCESDHAAERGLLVEAPGEHPPLRTPGAPYRMARTPWAAPAPPPRLDGPNAEGWRDPPWPPAREDAWRAASASDFPGAADPAERAAGRAARARSRPGLGRTARQPLPRRLRRGRDQGANHEAPLGFRRAGQLRPLRASGLGVDPAQPPLDRARPQGARGPQAVRAPLRRRRCGGRQLRAEGDALVRRRLRATDGGAPAADHDGDALGGPRRAVGEPRQLRALADRAVRDEEPQRLPGGPVGDGGGRRARPDRLRLRGARGPRRARLALAHRARPVHRAGAGGGGLRGPGRGGDRLHLERPRHRPRRQLAPLPRAARRLPLHGRGPVDRHRLRDGGGVARPRARRGPRGLARARGLRDARGAASRHGRRSTARSAPGPPRRTSASWPRPCRRRASPRSPSSTPTR